MGWQSSSKSRALRFALIWWIAFAAWASVPGAAADQTLASLAPGLHLGWGTFAPVADDQEALLATRTAEASAAGMDVGRVMVDWAQLEPSPGVYDREELDQQLLRLAPDGLRPLLTFSVTDVDVYSVPSDLLVSETELARPLDDPAVIARYLAMLDAILPGLDEERGAFLLSIANEPDVLLETRPPAETAALAAFAGAVWEHVRARYPALGVTLTISGPGLDNTELVRTLVKGLPVFALNWSCLDFDSFEVSAPERVPAEIAEIVAAADGRDVVIQELSCASGYEGRASLIGATPESQAAWFATFFAAIRAEPSIRAAFIFDAVDWPVDLANAYTTFLRDEGLPEIADRYAEFLATWGLFRFDDLAPKASWDAFLDALATGA